MNDSASSVRLSSVAWLALSKRQAVDATISPPPTRTMGSEMPNTSSTYEPTSIEPVISANMLRAMRRANSARVLDEAPSVSPKKMGAVAAGFRMGSSAASTNRKLLPNRISNSMNTDRFRRQLSVRGGGQGAR